MRIPNPISILGTQHTLGNYTTSKKKGRMRNGPQPMNDGVWATGLKGSDSERCDNQALYTHPSLSGHQ